MSNPSLILPQSPAYAVSNVYAAQVYDGEVPVYDVLPLTFTRASNGSRINTNGLVQQMGTNIPRVTYPVGGGCGALLLEKQSTNLLTYSEQMDSSDWFKTNLTITANATTSPDGTQNADLLDDGTASGTQHWIYQGPSISNSTAYTISFYAKYVSRKYMAINIFNGSTSQYVTYDIQNGSVFGSTGDVTASITSVGNGWYRVVYTRTMAASGSPNFRIALADDTGDITYTGSNKQVYMWGAQMEQSTYATSYISTISSSATRIADACYKTGISNIIGQTEGTLFIDTTFSQLNITGAEYYLSDGTNVIGIQIPPSAPNNFRAIIYIGGGFPVVIDVPFSTIGRYKIAFAYKLNDFVIYVNGVLGGSDTSGTVPACSQIGIDPAWGNGINQAQLYKNRLTNTELATLTTL